jgi:hypothetical protein
LEVVFAMERQAAAGVVSCLAPLHASKLLLNVLLLLLFEVFTMCCCFYAVQAVSQLPSARIAGLWSCTHVCLSGSTLVAVVLSGTDGTAALSHACRMHSLICKMLAY